MSKAKPSAGMVADMPSIMIAVESNTKISAKSLIGEVQCHDGIAISKAMAYRVKQTLQKDDDKSYKEEFYKIEPWIASFNEQNLRSFAQAFWGTDNRLLGVGMLNGAAVHVAQHSIQSCSFTDCAFMKHLYYNGQFMAIALVDGNLNNLVLACALVSGETKENYAVVLRLRQIARANAYGYPRR
jgi:hypothetical protein